MNNFERIEFGSPTGMLIGALAVEHGSDILFIPQVLEFDDYFIIFNYDPNSQNHLHVTIVHPNETVYSDKELKWYKNNAINK